VKLQSHPADRGPSPNWRKIRRCESVIPVAPPQREEAWLDEADEIGDSPNYLAGRDRIKLRVRKLNSN